MSIPDGFKVSEVGVIPVDWEVKYLRDCLIKNPDYGINAAAVPYSDMLPTYIRITDISEDGNFLAENKVSVIHQNAHNYFLEVGDIVLARTGASTGKSYLYNVKDGKLVFAGFLIRVRPDTQKLYPRYLKGYLETQSYWNWVKVMSMRSGQPGINGNEYSHLKIPLPPLAEQKAIAQSLSDVDNLITAIDKLITKKRNIKQGTMQELLTGKKRLSGFSGEWEVKKLGDLTTLVTNGFVGTATTQYTTSNDGILYIQGFNVIENGFNLTGIKRVNLDFHLKHSKSCLKEGDLLTVQTGDIGTTAIVTKELEGSNCHALIITRFKKGKADPHFFCQYFNSIYGHSKFKNIETGTTMKHINIGDFIEIILFIPPTIEEQKAIAKILTEMDAEIEALEKKREKYKNIKQGMMQQLLTGKTRIIDN